MKLHLITNFRGMSTLEKLNEVLETSLILISLYLLVFTKYHYLLVIPLILIYILFKMMHSFDKKNNLNVPSVYYTLGLIAVYLNIFGEFFFKFYYYVLYYDKALHLIVPIFLAIWVKWFIPKEIHFSKLIVVMAVLGLGALWETFEFFVDMLLTTPTMQGVFINFHIMQGGLEDTIQDLCLNLIGAIIGTFMFGRKNVQKTKV